VYQSVQLEEALVFGRLSDAARQALVRARQEAIDANHSYIGTEDLALALCGDQEEVAGRILAGLGVTHEALKAQALRIVANPPPSSSTRVPTSRTKRVIEVALQEATFGGSATIGTEHLLLALLVEAEGVAAHALEELGVSLPAVRRAVQVTADDRPEQAGSERARRVSTSSSVGMALMRAGRLAQEEGVSEIRTDHLLRALAESEIAEDQATLRKIGVSPAQAAAALRVPDEVRRLGLAVAADSERLGPAYLAGGDQATRALAELHRSSVEYTRAVSRWLELT
jgi:ATP-dependent Clp protease ATP-binding subunit ClpA